MYTWQLTNNRAKKKTIPKDDLCQVWLKLACWFWRKTSSHVYIFAIISPLKRTWPFIWTNLNSLHPTITCTKSDWIWPAGSGEEDFSKFSVYFDFRYYLPLEKGDPLPLNKLESPSPKDDLCQVWLKLAQWLWRGRFLNDPNRFLHFFDYLPFEEDLALYLNKLKFPSPKDNLY